MLIFKAGIPPYLKVGYNTNYLKIINVIYLHLKKINLVNIVRGWVSVCIRVCDCVRELWFILGINNHGFARV